MGHARNVTIIRISKLLNGMDFNKDYNPIKIYNNFKESECNHNKSDYPLTHNA